uniref:uncharacterized protein LOC122601273 n=1 Tax=Erigeron canadensis TaxID=72917 RepID=UPI001CB9099C|nr:uncharacterized protein LOC122601273 [Erigeron canadensis]
MAEHHNEKDKHNRRNEEEILFPEDSMDISDQIGRTLEKYTSLLLKWLNATMEGAMNNHIAQMIREEVAVNVQREFEKRDAKDKGKKTEEEKEVEVTGERIYKKKFTFRDFEVCHPPGITVTVIPSFVQETVGRDSGMVMSEAEVTKLRSEFLNDCQGNLSLNEFRAQFLDKAQVFLEFLENDQLLKEQFYLKLGKNLIEKISLRQMESFSMLADVARDQEIEQSRVEEGDSKRKHEDTNSPNKRFRQEGSSGNNSTRRNIPFCRQCKRNHSGVCRASEKGCYNCGKPGHTSRECKSKPHDPVICFKCYEEGHVKSSCPKFTKEERLEKRRRKAERKNAQAHGNQRGRSFQLTVEQARNADDVVTGTFLVYNVPMQILFDSGANRSFVN